MSYTQLGVAQTPATLFALGEKRKIKRKMYRNAILRVFIRHFISPFISPPRLPIQSNLP